MYCTGLQNSLDNYVAVTACGDRRVFLNLKGTIDSKLLGRAITRDWHGRPL